MLIIRNNSNADLNSTGDRQGQKFVLPLLDLGMILWFSQLSKLIKKLKAVQRGLGGFPAEPKAQIVVFLRQ